MATIRSNKIKYSISENFILSKNYSLGLYFDGAHYVLTFLFPSHRETNIDLLATEK